MVEVKNHKAAVALNYFVYKFIRIHRTLRVTPVMVADVTARLWEVYSGSARRGGGWKKAA